MPQVCLACVPSVEIHDYVLKFSHFVFVLFQPKNQRGFEKAKSHLAICNPFSMLCLKFKSLASSTP